MVLVELIVELEYALLNSNVDSEEELLEDDPDLTLHPKGKGVSNKVDHKLAGSLAKVIANALQYRDYHNSYNGIVVIESKC